ncbi:MAG: hypothetical protein FWC68_00330 [Oscillospiraceae bacterium]|nr:hypothetical protein [Oscillospiraceae bacterium]
MQFIYDVKDKKLNREKVEGNPKLDLESHNVFEPQMPEDFLCNLFDLET